ncbi:extracellular solute-binding protein [Aquamicrobium sp. NLF2-7]|uniref:ABC transporter substrate-binding protein n=1 Tax=Aquamicrobium sp. NLF2-7 TaxID=2918753 RepID=UPI001EFACCBE|nr:extracellular solute-binding protein [Aquamicrobium sp. NLF2-7]MCG8274322.1 extracellular solute-binding protein [Aquamicrobium sp. NLF2-7]
MKFIKQGLLAAGVALSLGAALPANAQTTVTVLSHKVHENVARGLVAGTTGGDVAGEWAKANNVTLNWVTGNIDPIHDRLGRELSLSESSVDLAFVINKFHTPRIAALLEPLDERIAAEPIEILDSIPEPLKKALMHDGKLTAIPFRHATTGLHWNKTLFAEQGLDHAPRTLDELLEYARKMSYTRSDGTRVAGLIMNSGDEHVAVLTLLSAFGARLFDDEGKVVANTPEMIRGLSTMAELYKEGVLAQNYATMTIDDVITAVQNGQAAMAIDPFARYAVYNNPESSKFPGQIDVVVTPSTVNPEGTAITEIWSMAIPRNAKNKDLAYSLMRALSGREATIRIALNANGPVDPTAYSDARLQEKLPYTEAEARALRIAQVIPSSFDRSIEAAAIFREESQAAVLGLKSAEDAAAAMQARIERLVD